MVDKKTCRDCGKAFVFAYEGKADYESVRRYGRCIKCREKYLAKGGTEGFKNWWENKKADGSYIGIIIAIISAIVCIAVIIGGSIRISQLQRESEAIRAHISSNSSSRTCHYCGLKTNYYCSEHGWWECPNCHGLYYHSK